MHRILQLFHSLTIAIVTPNVLTIAIVTPNAFPTEGGALSIFNMPLARTHIVVHVCVFRNGVSCFFAGEVPW